MTRSYTLRSGEIELAVRLYLEATLDMNMTGWRCTTEFMLPAEVELKYELDE